MEPDTLPISFLCRTGGSRTHLRLRRKQKILVRKTGWRWIPTAPTLRRYRFSVSTGRNRTHLLPPPKTENIGAESNGAAKITALTMELYYRGELNLCYVAEASPAHGEPNGARTPPVSFLRQCRRKTARISCPRRKQITLVQKTVRQWIPPEPDTPPVSLLCQLRREGHAPPVSAESRKQWCKNRNGNEYRRNPPLRPYHFMPAPAGTARVSCLRRKRKTVARKAERKEIRWSSQSAGIVFAPAPTEAARISCPAGNRKHRRGKRSGNGYRWSPTPCRYYFYVSADGSRTHLLPPPKA